MSLACGIDVGGTKILGGVVDDGGAIVEELRVESPATDTEAIEKAIEELVTELKSRHEITAVGVGAAGYIDKAALDGDVRAQHRLARRQRSRPTSRRASTSRSSSRTTRTPPPGASSPTAPAMTSTTCCSSPSAPASAAASCTTASCSAARSASAAEIGHMRVVPDGLLCGCGNRGCFEQYASGNALVREARAAARAGSLLAQSLLDLRGRRPRADHRAADHRGGPRRRPVRHRAARRRSAAGWARASPSLTAVLDPAVVVIGGGVGEAGDLLLDAGARGVPVAS